MPLSLETLRAFQVSDPREAWLAIADYAWTVFNDAPKAKNPEADVVKRDRALADVDLFLATAGWELWLEYPGTVKRTADALAEWWAGPGDGKAVLILDALSLRELPWILEGLNERGYTLHEAGVTGAELPADTTPFARALGFASRSSLYNNGAGGSHRLVGARTEALDTSWEDAASQIGPEPRWVVWHAWPDSRVHELSKQGRGLQDLIGEAKQALTSDGFWSLIHTLTQGRRLILTADHGYAATGMFPDIDPAQAPYMKQLFKSGRSVEDDGSDAPWIPPTDLSVETVHGRHRLALGRRKWKSSGGYPTLAHGGLTVLEVLVPFLEISRMGDDDGGR